jgi:hypothetical protein
MVPLERPAVRVVADSATVVNFVMQLLCYAVHLDSLPLLPHCRAVGGNFGLDSTEQLEAALLCTTVAITVGREPPPSAVCLAIGGSATNLGTDPSPRMISALSGIGPPAYPMSGCQVLTSYLPYRVRSTGAIAWRIYVEGVHVTAPGHATTASASDKGTMSAAGWECTFERDASGWYPKECQMVWQS